MRSMPKLFREKILNSFSEASWQFFRNFSDKKQRFVCIVDFFCLYLQTYKKAAMFYYIHNIMKLLAFIGRNAFLIRGRVSVPGI